MKLNIRKVQKEELSFLQEFARRVIDENYRSFLGDDAVNEFINSGASDQYMLENLSDMSVAILKDEIVGVCVCKENLIDLFMIKSSMHNMGIGRMFLKMMTQELLKTYINVRIESFEDNQKANLFYEKNGFEKVKTDSGKIYYSFK